MKFTGFDRSVLDELSRLPKLDAAGYASRRELLSSGLDLLLTAWHGPDKKSGPKDAQ